MSIHDQPAYPLTAGRVARLAGSLFRFAWRDFLASAAICLLPSLVVAAVVSASYGDRLAVWLDEARRASTLGLPGPAPPPNFEISIVALALSTILSVVSGLVAYAAIVRIASAVFGGQRTGVLEAVRHGAGRLLSLVGGQLLVFVGILIILMLGVVAGVALLAGGGIFAFLGLIVSVATLAAILFFVVRTNLFVQAIVIEGVGGAEGVSRSFGLVAGSGWRVFGYIFVVGLVSSATTLILTSGPEAAFALNGDSAGDVIARAVLQTFATVVIAPLQPIVLTLLYFDLRWRQGETVPMPGGGETTGPVRPVMTPRRGR